MFSNRAVSQVNRYLEYAKNMDAQLANLINISAVGKVNRESFWRFISCNTE